MKTKMLIAMIIIVLSAALAAAAFAEDSFTFEVTEGFSFAEETDNAAIDISVPRVSGMADENDEILLNAHFLAKKDEIIADYKQNVEMAAANYPDGNGPHFEYKYSWDTGVVKFQYTEGNSIYEKEYLSLSALYSDIENGEEIILLHQ